MGVRRGEGRTKTDLLATSEVLDFLPQKMFVFSAAVLNSVFVAIFASPSYF